MPQRLIDGYHRFREGYFLRYEKELTMLAEGQSPEIAIVSCCDSRVDPAVIFDAHPGDLFVIRNVANLVPPHDNDGRPKGTSSALEFAVTGLKVSHIVVLGHAQCGGIAALMNKESDGSNRTFIDQWMSIAEPAKKLALARSQSSGDTCTECEKAAIEQSLDNLMTFPWIEEAVNADKLKIHGWYYNLAQGTLSCFDSNTDTFVAV